MLPLLGHAFAFPQALLAPCQQTNCSYKGSNVLRVFKVFYACRASRAAWLLAWDAWFFDFSGISRIKHYYFR
jgi:hypothetical protein